MLEYIKQRRQWVLYGVDKIPKQINGYGASSTDRSTWASYEDVKTFAQTHLELRLGVGYVITADDNITCIDLDTYKAGNATTLELHNQIAASFPTYQELSPSAQGLHIWCYGKAGTRKYTSDAFEIYDRDHYITVTEQPFANVPIADCGHVLASLIQHFDSTRGNSQISTIVDTVEVLTDQEILTKVAQSSVGDKFKLLWEGKYQEYFATYHPNAKDKSQSEADLALCNFLSFYTDSKSQLARLFRISDLGKRKKAQRNDYVSGLARKSFDLKQSQAIIAPEVLALKRAEIVEDEIEEEDSPVRTLPSGLLGEVVNYIYSCSIQQSPEVAIAGGIALLAGMCGRQYNTHTLTGLNQYIVLLASSAHGKEGASRGITKLAAAAAENTTGFDTFLGPSEIASAQGLLRHMEKVSQCFLTRKGEFGMWMQRINSKWAKGNELHIKAVLLDLFHKSGADDVLMGSTYSDVAKNIPNIKSPAVTILGDSTPEEFYKAIDEANIAEGMVSRLTIIAASNTIQPVYNEHGPRLNPPVELVYNLQMLGKLIKSYAQINKVVIVGETPEASAFQRDYRQKTAQYIWDNQDKIESRIMHRTHIRLLRLGALIAVARNPNCPEVDIADYKWANQLIEHGTNTIMRKFEQGLVGERSLGNDQYKLAYQWCKRYQLEGMPAGKLKSARMDDRMNIARVFKRAAAHQALCNLAPYRHDRISASNALSQVLKQLESNGVIKQLPKQVVEQFGATGDMFQVVET
jgi:hypothetical protein